MLSMMLLIGAASLWPTDAQARRQTPVKVPTIAEVVEAEGFTPTPSQSELYRPGVVLVPNKLGGHDEVVGGCIVAEFSVAPMAQSSIATTLSAGVRARIGAGNVTAAAGVEKRLTFINPEQRTIGLGDLRPTAECREKLELAGQIRELSDAVVVHDVLVAIVQNTVCTRADASGGVIALGKAEASAYSECVQESNTQVPLGFKAIPLDKIIEATSPPPPAPPTAAKAPLIGSGKSAPSPGDCPWSSIQSGTAQSGTLVINGDSFNIRGPNARAMSAQLRMCGEGEAALALDEWRKRTRRVALSWIIVPPYSWLFLSRAYKNKEEARQQMIYTLN